MTLHSGSNCLMAVTGMFHTGGGVATVNRMTLRALAEENCHIDIFSLTEDDPSIDPRYIPLSDATMKVFKGNKLRFVLTLWHTLITKKYDLIIVDHINIASSLAPLSLIRRISYIVWLHTAELLPPLPNIEGRVGLHNAWKRLANSPYTKNLACSQFPNIDVMVCDLALDPVQHNSSITSGQGCAADNAPRLRAIDGMRYDLNERFILHVGRIQKGGRGKGQEPLLHAFPTIVKYYPDAQLVLAGDGDGKDLLVGQARSLPIEVQSRIFLPGYVDDDLLDWLYRSCFLFAMPSIGEGFGLVYIEAMSRAKPCLGARANATPYVVEDKVTGLLVDSPVTEQEVTEKICWFLAHPEEASAMGRAGLEKVRQRYQFSDFKKRFFSLVQD